MTPREECQAALASPNLQAFLRVIREGETGQTDAAYRTLVGGSLLPNLQDHPRKRVYLPKLDVTSTAAGAYQFLSRTWDGCAKALGLTDFSPASQDLAAVYLIRGRKALGAILAGDLEETIRLCGKEWASLPGSPYGQPTQSMAQARAIYLQWGGTLEEWAPSPSPSPEPASIPAGEIIPETPMPGFLAAALPALVQVAPELIRIFGKSPQAEKNAKAAEVVAELAKDVTAEATEQGAVKALADDPALAARFREAVHKSLTSGELVQVLIEAGEADESSRRKALDRNLELSKATGGKWLWLLGTVALIVVIVSYGITAGVLFSKSTTFSDETKALLLGQIIIFGFVTVLAFLFGSNIQNRIAQRERERES